MPPTCSPKGINLLSFSKRVSVSAAGILSPEYQGFFSDLGPSWYWPAIHPIMAHLIQALGLKGYRQFEEGLGRFQSPNGAVQTVSGYAMEPLSWRLSGGMVALITKTL